MLVDLTSILYFPPASHSSSSGGWWEVCYSKLPIQSQCAHSPVHITGPFSRHPHKMDFPDTESSLSATHFCMFLATPRAQSIDYSQAQCYIYIGSKSLKFHNRHSYNAQRNEESAMTQPIQMSTSGQQVQTITIVGMSRLKKYLI